MTATQEIPDEMLPLFQGLADGLGCAGVLGLFTEGALLMALALAIRQGTPALPMSDRLIELVRTLQAARLPKPDATLPVPTAVH